MRTGEPLLWLRAMRDSGAPSLPARVQRLVDAQEMESERLIGWVQLGVVCLFATLYLVAPRPSDAPDGMLLHEPVPVALAGYLAFTLGRIVLAYRGPLSPSLLVASILADVGLLIGMIWSFHLQYGQAAPFSLKVPTFVYLFVFIALRALRFDAHYLLAAGLAAIVGWGALVTAVLASSGPAVLTRSFATHLNESMVLIGAEIDKLATLLLVTGVLALAAARGRRLFVAAVRSEAAVSDLRRFFGAGVPDTVTGAEDAAIAGLAHEREAAILMLDIRGFTALSQRLSPQAVVEVLTSLHARVIPIVHAHGGVVDKFMGDGIMATFGAVTPSPRAAADAMRALTEVMKAAEEWQAVFRLRFPGEPVEVNGAAAAGTVLFAVVGAGDRLEYTVIGEAVNLAAKLEKHNKTEHTRGLATRPTYDLAVAQGFIAPAPADVRLARSVAGVSMPLDLVVTA